MKQLKRPVSILLSILLIAGLFTIVPVTASGAVAQPYYIDVNGGACRCFLKFV